MANTAGQVRIVTDSACDLRADELAEFGIEVVPLTIRFGDEEFTDGRDLSVEDFYRRMDASSALPETAAPSPGAFEQAFKKMAGEGAAAVVCINLSSDLSATMQSAVAAAGTLAGELDVRVVDSHSITAGLGLQVMEAARAADAGRSADDVVALLEELSPRSGCATSS
jgi:DegV family protein with EDD domain